MAYGFGTVKRLVGTNDPSSKIQTINNPLTIAKPEALDLSSKGKEILFVGRLTGQKGVDYLLDVWKMFSEQEQIWKLRIVGDGPMRQEMEERISNENIPNIIFEGNQKDVSQYYKQSQILCVTSRFEGWPLVLTEGMSYGNIAVAFNSYGAVYDIINNGNNGYIIDAFDCKEYTRQLLQLTRDNDLRKKMAENAFNSSDRFNMKNIVSKWEIVISE